MGRKRRKTLRKIWVVCMVLILAAAASGCASRDKQTSENTAQQTETYSTEADEGVMRTAEDADGTFADGEGTADAAEETILDTEAADTSKETTQKLIVTYRMQAETKTFDSFLEKLETSVESSGGYVEAMNLYTTTGKADAPRAVSYTLRVPIDKAKGFNESLEAMVNVLSRSENTEDVTLSYVDTKSRIDALKAEQESLMKLMEQADTMEGIIAIQTQLTQIRYELQSYESQLRVLDNQVSYSTIHLNVSEVERESATTDSFMDRLGERFSESLESLRTEAVNFAIGFIGGVPVWLPIAVLVLIAILIIRKIVKTYSKKHRPKPPEGPGLSGSDRNHKTDKVQMNLSGSAKGQAQPADTPKRKEEKSPEQSKKNPDTKE